MHCWLDLRCAVLPLRMSMGAHEHASLAAWVDQPGCQPVQMQVGLMLQKPTVEQFASSRISCMSSRGVSFTTCESSIGWASSALAHAGPTRALAGSQGIKGAGVAEKGRGYVFEPQRSQPAALRLILSEQIFDYPGPRKKSAMVL